MSRKILRRSEKRTVVSGQTPAFTEGCQKVRRASAPGKPGNATRNLIGDFNNYNEGFIDWNLFLDETGGPNHVNNLCDAPMIIKVDRKNRLSKFLLLHRSFFTFRKTRSYEDRVFRR